MYYTNPLGVRRKIAQCLFSGGVNSAYIKAAADENGDGKSDCLLEANWENIDGGENDGARNAGNFVFTTNEENYLDVLNYSYNAVTNKLSWRNTKYMYPKGKNALPSTQVDAYIAASAPVPGKGIFIDPLVDESTDRLFDDLMISLEHEPVREPMSFGVLCDLNFDGLCNATDRLIFDGALGKCTPQTGYQPRADIDKDGCVTLQDRDAWTEVLQRHISSCTRGVGYWKNSAGSWPINSMFLGTREYVKKELMAILVNPAGGNGLVSLTQQLIAAKLNASTGPLSIQGTIATADKLINEATTGSPLPPLGTAYLSSRYTSPLGRLLEDYNEGRSPPGACLK
jgi:hypothetical protein